MKNVLDGRNKTHMIFYIAGLSIAMAGFILSFLYVLNERKYDRSYKDHRRIFRAESRFIYGPGKEQLQATSPIPLAPSLMKDYPEVESAVRVSKPYPETLLSTKSGRKFIERQGIWADNSLFTVFSFSFIRGSSKNALTQPLSIVLTEKLAEKYFSGEDPIGKKIRINNHFNYKITGVIKDIPVNSHFDFSFVVSSDFSGTLVGGWDSSLIFTYVLLNRKGQTKELSRSLREILKENGVVTDKEIYLKPLTKIYLGPDIFFEFGRKGNRKIVSLCFWVAFLILLTVLMVFTDAAAPKKRSNNSSDIQAKIKAVLPSTFLKTLFSGILAVIMCFVFLPAFERLVNRTLTVGFFGFLLALVLSVIITSFLSTLSAVFFRIEKSGISKTFTILQLFFFLILFIAFLKITNKVAHLKNEDQGIDKDNIVAMDFSRMGKDNLGKCMALKNELLKNPNILEAGFSLHFPLGRLGTSAVAVEGAGKGREVMANINFVNADFCDTYGLELTGESRDISSQTEISPGEWACFINETAAEEFKENNSGLRNSRIIGKRLVFSDGHKPIISGVVRDFPFSFSMDKVKPLVIVYQIGNEFIYPKLSLSLYSGDIVNTLDFIHNKFKVLFPEDVFECRFFDKYYSNIFQDDVVLKNMLGFFSALAFFIFIMGLLSRRARFFVLGEQKRYRFLGRSNLLFFGFIKWLVVYLYILLFIEPYLFYYGFGKMMELPLYTTGWRFLKQSIAHPGGLTEFLAGFLSQFFYINWVGALVITVVAWGLSKVSARLIALVGGKSSYRMLGYIPALLFIMSYNYYDHALLLGLALLTAFFFSFLYIKSRIKPVSARILWFCILFVVLYFIAGGACLFFAMLAVINECFFRREYTAAVILFATAAIVPYLVGTLIFDLHSSAIFLSLTPFYSGWANMDSALILQSMFIFVPGLIIFLLLFPSKKAGSSSQVKLLAKIIPYAVLLLLFIVSNVITFNKNKKTLYQLMYFSHINKWEQVLDQAQKLPSDTYNLYCNYQINRALYHSGRLGEEMFSFPQHMDAFALIPFETERFLMRDAAVIEVSLELGSLNIAEYLSLELMEVAGNSPFFLRDLALINVVKKQTDTARVFLNALCKDLIFRKKAKSLLSRLDKDPDLENDRQVQYLRHVMLEKDVANIDVESLLLELLEKNRYNRMAFEYLMAYYLMERRVDKVAENFARLDELGYKDIPRNYEEAILLHSLDTGGTIKLYGKKLRPETLEKFQAFSEIMSSSAEISRQAASRELMQKFGSTYFFYYSFDLSGMAK